MKKSFANKYLWNKYAISVCVIILILVVYFLAFNNSTTQKIDFAIATIENISEKVSVTGKISPVEKADLSFEKGGVLKTVNFKVGDRVKKGDILATLESLGDKAALASAEAKLSDLTRSLNAPEMALEQSKVNTAKVALVNAKQDALNAVRMSLIQTKGAINNYTDTFFSNPQSANPTINIRTQSQNGQTAINNSRVLVSDTLLKWKNDIDLATSTESAIDLLDKANSYLFIVKNFMDQLSLNVNDLNPGNSGMTRAAIDTSVLTMNSGLSGLNQAIDSVASAKTILQNSVSAYDQANSNFLLKDSGSSQQTIAAQSAIVDSYKAELAKDKMISPIEGIIIKVEPNIGEFVSPGSIAFGIISDGDYKIEAYVPEADIAKVMIGNIASTTLDAYGQNVDFPASIVAIDPAETILEGVPTYKITLKFINKDVRIRSGMTANLDILTQQRNSVVTVPTRAVMDVSGVKSVRVMNADGKSFASVPVTMGLKGSDGSTEIVKGIREGDKVVTYVK